MDFDESDIQASYPDKFVCADCFDDDQHSTESLTIHHKVKDYPAWRKGYDEHEKSRVSAGITNGKVFRGAEDPNDVLILQDVADMGKARAWLGCGTRPFACPRLVGRRFLGRRGASSP
jgi:hypothetical protein